jgi:hypothetical protein
MTLDQKILGGAVGIREGSQRSGSPIIPRAAVEDGGEDVF